MRRISILPPVIGLAAVVIASFAIGMATVGREQEQSATAQDAQDLTEASLASNSKPAESVTTVTYDEFESALQEYRTCVETAGFVYTGIPGEGLRPSTMQFTIPDSDGLADSATTKDAGRVYSECAEPKLRELGLQWSLQQQQPTGEQLEAVNNRIAQCMGQHAEIPEVSPAAQPPRIYEFGAYTAGPGLSIERDEIKLYGECGLIAQAETGVLAPEPRIAE